jgi:hypothetical protein
LPFCLLKWDDIAQRPSEDETFASLQSCGPNKSQFFINYLVPGIVIVAENVLLKLNDINPITFLVYYISTNN